MVDILYSAIPPSSELYSRLQSDKAFATLLSWLFPYGNGIFCYFEDEPDESDEVLENVCEVYPEIFESQVELDRVIAEFRSQLTLTRQAFPGIEDRTAMLEKSVNEIEQRLVQELTTRQVANAEEMVQKLLFGDRTFAPDLLSEGDSLGLISRELVREGASIFRQIDPKTLFAKNEDWYFEQLEELKDLYLAADEHNEVILIASC
ncbi:hypothetical protein [Synechocystis sp. PCC 7509]|uniref:hypothetical protein n=1 Tax=Synechocystis sp. PCC 7509 TaxID=927677 RepID=UPI0002ACCF48|nr:hypothetical protein [Synechocystis sp. PCC 7509]